MSFQQKSVRQQRSISTKRKRPWQVPALYWSCVALWNVNCFSNLSYHCALKLSFQTVSWLDHWILCSPQREVLTVSTAGFASFSVSVGKVAQVHGPSPALLTWLQMGSRRSRAQTSCEYTKMLYIHGDLDDSNIMSNRIQCSSSAPATGCAL